MAAIPPRTAAPNAPTALITAADVATVVAIHANAGIIKTPIYNGYK